MLRKLFGLKPKRMPLSISDANFQEEVLQSDVPVILDLWSPGCAPCKQLAEVMITLATEFDGQVKVCEVNVATSPRTAGTLQVRGTPTVVYFNKGKELERIVGMRGSLYHRQTIEALFGIAG